ncbi:hypothetical protein Dimus_020263 [Dionaea muscipula]
MVYLSPSRDEYYMVATGNSLALNSCIQEEQVVPARYRQEFLTIAWEQVHLRSLFPFQYFSIGASLIPFIEHNDANRALMSSNMQRQAVPLSQSEKCIVGTRLEHQAALDSGGLAIAEHEGKIISTDTDKIVFSGNGYTLTIPLIRYQAFNKNTSIDQNPRIPPGKWIKKGQVLADAAATVGGELALGKNVLLAYMPWEGYNFEDAVLISEHLVYGDIFTSFHIRKYEIQIHVTSRGPERVTREIPHLEARLLRNLDKNGIVMLGSWVETGDILVGKLSPQTTKESSYASEDRLLRTILGIQISTSKETCLKLPIGGRGRVIDVRWIQKRGGSSYNPEMIRVYILQKREIKVGDKVAGRHGNKGVISQILPRQDMPYLQDGRPVDMVFNPLGVPSRMNVGQILECSLGLAGSLLDRHYRIAPFDERYEQEASRKLVFSELYEASKQTANPWVFEPEYPGKSRILDGRTGDPFEQPVIIGNPYIFKLIHQVDDKFHGRSSGPYALVTQQPLRGRPKQGGNRTLPAVRISMAACKEFYANLTVFIYKKKEIARSKVKGVEIEFDSMKLAIILDVPGHTGISDYIKEVWEESKRRDDDNEASAEEENEETEAPNDFDWEAVIDEAADQGESGSGEKFYDAEDEIQEPAVVVEEVPAVVAQASAQQKETEAAGVDPSGPSGHIPESVMNKLQAEFKRVRANRFQANMEKAQAENARLLALLQQA